ncbi:hypothetical protein DLP05_014 [Stenotrophomonas phage vB_SmaS_DLP_5]|uniref:DUF7210 domain-containing protein n=1 Tax=Stenotrophomonas phage vB_SmaS_DLP_5 TaxID=2044561 RepID=A0A2D2W2U0_9CAUD|nr:hypothetical protein FDJ07_gp013 [Stenotrophomonas phage vB_SmaS_DLP_5]ATS92360.1 hypothetical protein DLP05_014 [Stenotrophomonas phage vB_SmaS_DLP_5]
MADKEKTVEVTLSKKHQHEGVERQKGEVIEVKVSDLPLLEDFKVVEEGSVQPTGTHQKKLDDEAKKKADEFQTRIDNINKSVPDKVDDVKPETVEVKSPTPAAPATEVTKTPVSGAGNVNKETK